MARGTLTETLLLATEPGADAAQRVQRLREAIEQRLAVLNDRWTQLRTVCPPTCRWTNSCALLSPATNQNVHCCTG